MPTRAALHMSPSQAWANWGSELIQSMSCNIKIKVPSQGYNTDWNYTILLLYFTAAILYFGEIRHLDPFCGMCQVPLSSGREGEKFSL